MPFPNSLVSATNRLLGEYGGNGLCNGGNTAELTRT